MTPNGAFYMKCLVIDPAKNEAIPLLFDKIFAQPLKLGVVSSNIVVETIPVMPVTDSLCPVLVRQVH